MGLSDAEDRPVREWSGGMKRRLALARALLADAEAIALDEPFAGLDAENRRHGAECIARRAETTPVLLVTHDRADLEPNARIIECGRGKSGAAAHPDTFIKAAVSAEKPLLFSRQKRGLRGKPM